MKYFIIGWVTIFIAGCSAESDYSDNKVLYDGDGCAFYTRKHLGDTSVVRLVPNISKETCKYKEKIK